MCFKIISGGQDGAEQGAIDAAIDLGVKYAGAVVPESFSLETQIERNILSSNGMVVFYYGQTNGQIATAVKTAVLLGYPCMVVDFSTNSIEQAVVDVSRWIDQNRITKLYVTGVKTGEDRRIYTNTRTVVSKTIARIRYGCDSK